MIVDTAMSGEVVSLVERTVRERLGALADAIETRFEENQQGEPAIFIDIFLSADAPRTLGSRFAEAQLALVAALEGQGDTRFPYLSLKWPNDQYPKEIEPLVRRRRA